MTIVQYDGWLANDGPAAILLNRALLPAEGEKAWIFPPTFARAESADDSDEGTGGAYQIDKLPGEDGTNVCVIDSIGSQANRIEPIFKEAPYSSLVPQITIRVKADDETVNLLDAGHRAADAVIRFSKDLGPKIWDAFSRYKTKRDCSLLAKLAPTSLVFGVWDSRATGVKIQRIVRSTIRAYNVTEAKRSATYQASCDYTGNGVIDTKYDKGSGKDNPLSQEGFKYSLATNTHGGVLVNGGIKQEAVVNLVALRTLTDDIKTKRYLLGLALVSLSYRDQAAFNLREGCLLCAASKEDYEGKWTLVGFDGMRNPEQITHESALEYARLAASEFGVTDKIDANFDSQTANAWLNIDKKKRKTVAKTKHPAKALADGITPAAATANKDDKPIEARQ